MTVRGLAVTLAVASVVLCGCRSTGAPSPPAGADPVGSVESTIGAVERGFVDDSTAGR